MTKTCLTCGASLQGRADKKFCSDQCRSGYNNNFHCNNRDYIRRVNYILKKNRRILTELRSEGQTCIRMETLRVKGFDFNYFTSLQSSPEGIYYYCYEHGFMRSEHGNDLILVTRDGV